MDIAAALRAFAAVFPAELPDKTMVATVLLVAQYQRPLPVWCGAAAAFAIHVTVAVTAGQLLTLLPDTVVAVGTGTLFTVGAVLLWRGAHEADEEVAEVDGAHEADSGAATSSSDTSGTNGDQTPAPARAGLRPRLANRGNGAVGAMAGAFGVILVAEWGDLTQVATATTAASTGAPVAVAVGALLALWSVAALAARLGRAIVARLPAARLRRAAAVVFASLAVVTLVPLLPTP
jgi:Ca2+/H+ antiporter, TMEM165/GDT1 family